MNGFRDFIEEVRSRTNIVELIGVDLALKPSGSTLKACSPFNPETDPSFVVWPGTQTWRDFSNGSGRGGDVFAYVQERDKVGFKEALFHLAGRAQVKRPAQSDDDFRRELELLVEKREVLELLTRAANYYHKILPSKIREESYRRHYGFTDNTIDELKLGWADGHLFEALCETTDRERALKTGLFVELAGGCVEDFFKSRLVFPYWKNGTVVYFIARATEYTGDEEWEKSKYKKLITQSDRHPYVSQAVANDHFYNEEGARGADELLITEGVTDCISAMQAGVACISPVTTRFRKQDVAKLLQLTKYTKRVVVCNDSEASGAGEAGARETAAALFAEGRDVRVAVIPRPAGADKIDVNELVATQGADALRVVMAQAKSYPDHLLSAIAADTDREELDRLLEPIFELLIDCRVIKADAVLTAVERKFHIKRSVLNARMKELKSRRREPWPVAGSLPQIRVDGKQLHEIVADARRVLLRSNEQRIKAPESELAPLFVRDGRVVRLQRPSKGAPILSDVGDTVMYGYLLRMADWVRLTIEGMFPVSPPKDVARDLIAHPPPGIPQVEAVITTPMFGRDGRLIAEPGLHETDRLWLEADASLHVGAISDSPRPEEIDAAKRLLVEDLLVDFPFVSDADRAHALAALLLPFVRRMIDGCTPLHIVEAPTVGSGKGLFCNLVSLVVSGRPCDSRTLPEDDNEIRKAITAELAMARPIVLFDNAKENWTLSSAPFASALTALSWTDRILGRTEMITLPNAAMWMLTGNNIRLSKDLARRSVRIRIDPKRDRAWRRTGFKHDPLMSWAVANRDELVHAALILVRAWISAGRQTTQDRLGSFEQWAAIMGGLLKAAGVVGFLGNLEELYADADVDGEAWREFTLLWWEHHAAAEMRVADLVDFCEKHDLMLQVRGDGSVRSQQSRLGRALQGGRDRMFGDLQLVVLNQDRKTRTQYALRRQAADPAHATVAPPIEVDPWS